MITNTYYPRAPLPLPTGKCVVGGAGWYIRDTPSKHCDVLRSFMRRRIRRLPASIRHSREIAGDIIYVVRGLVPIACLTETVYIGIVVEHLSHPHLKHGLRNQNMDMTHIALYFAQRWKDLA